MRRVLAILACSLLVACAPAVVGTSPSNPIPLDFYESTELPSGGVSYVKAIVSPDMFDLAMGSLTSTQMDTARVGKRYTYDVSRSFEMLSASAPAGWDVQFVLAQRVHEIAQTRSMGRHLTVNSEVSLELVFAVDVPGSCRGGVHELVVEIERDGLVRAIPLVVACP